MHWKTKAVLANLQGKGQQGYVNSNISPCIGYVSPEEVVPDPAWAYVKTVGAIWDVEIGAYVNRWKPPVPPTYTLQHSEAWTS